MFGISNRYPFWVFFFISLLLLQGCSNSVRLLGPAYERLDNMVKHSLTELTDLNDEQESALNDLVKQFHDWHRRAELPRYQALIDEVRQTIANGKYTAVADTSSMTAPSPEVVRWFGQVESGIDRLRLCHPVNNIAPLISSASDEQIEQALAAIQADRAKHQKRYKKYTEAERAERRANNMIKWLDRAGLELYAAQEHLIHDTFKQQISLRQAYFSISQSWFEELPQWLAKRHEPGFEAEYLARLTALWESLEKAHPEEWQSNQQLWQIASTRLLASLNAEQRKLADIWLGKLSNTIGKIHADAPAATDVSADKDSTMASRMNCAS